MQWETIIGLETHIQLLTQSKIFSNASTEFGAISNTQINSIDLALPGTLPILNKQAVKYAIRFAIASGATISPYSIFTRKHYFYPDLSKGYQISQYAIPIMQGGHISFLLKNNNKIETRTIQLHCAHLEEDAGKLFHKSDKYVTGIDFNRAGMPLLEIVTKPDIRSATEAIAYAKELHLLVTWLGICNGNMEEGSFRCDVNVSVRPVGQKEFGTRCEIKNLNSFRFIEDAINYEIQRQIKLIQNGDIVTQETRLYDSDKKETRSMRNKENSQDYRYFPDPDLPPLVIKPIWIEHIKTSMPELPHEMRKRLSKEYKLSEYTISIITQSKNFATYFEAILIDDKNQAKLAANWLTGHMIYKLNEENIDIVNAPINPIQLSMLLERISDGTISHKIAKEIFLMMWNAKSNNNKLVDDIIKTENLEQISSNDTIEVLVDQILKKNMKLVSEFHSGKKRAIHALIGKVMQLTKNKVDPIKLNKLFYEKLQKDLCNH